MMFGFLRPRNVEEIASLRDRALIAETKVLLLTDMVERQRRPTRERRKDSAKFMAAKARTTEALMRMQGRVG